MAVTPTDPPLQDADVTTPDGVVHRVTDPTVLAQETCGWTVEQWLRVPPNVEEVDPTAVPKAHRQLFLQAAELVAKADGKVVPAEKDSLAIFRDLLDG